MSMKIAIIGAGGIAERAYFPLLVQKPEVEIVSLYSRTQATLDRVTSQWKIEHATTDMQAVLDSRPQAAFVLSSNHSHFDICTLMLENGIDVYVEKPLAMDMATLNRVFDLVKAGTQVVQMGTQVRSYATSAGCM